MLSLPGPGLIAGQGAKIPEDVRCAKKRKKVFYIHFRCLGVCVCVHTMFSWLQAHCGVSFVSPRQGLEIGTRHHIEQKDEGRSAERPSGRVFLTLKEGGKAGAFLLSGSHGLCSRGGAEVGTAQEDKLWLDLEGRTEKPGSRTESPPPETAETDALTDGSSRLPGPCCAGCSVICS